MLANFDINLNLLAEMLYGPASNIALLSSHHIMRCHWLLLLFLIFSHFYVGSMCLMRLLHLARSCVSSLDNSFSDKSFPMVSIHLRFGLPLLLFPGTSIPIPLLPTYSSSLLNTCPYHFNLLSCTFSHLRCPSNSFIPNSVQLGDSTHPS